jgi:maltose alpha-D-glucosyltransferase/alpha-amylase
VTNEAAQRARAGNAVLASLKTPEGEALIVDALDEPEASRSIVRAILQRTRVREGVAELWATCSIDPESVAPLGDPHSLPSGDYNATLHYGDQLLLKHFRRMEDGLHPDLEMGRFLGVHAPGLTPRVVGSLELRSGRAAYNTLAVLQEYVPNEGTAWSLTRRELGRFYERALSQPHNASPPAVPMRGVLALAVETLPREVDEALGAYQEQAWLLGKRTAEMHKALASVADDPAFSPEAYSALDRRSLYQSFRNQVGRVLRSLRAELPRLPPEVQPLARSVLAHERETVERFEPLLHITSSGLRIRCHGDFDLKQALWTGKDFVLVDFDGGTDRALSERRRKRSPLRDVASMMLSFHYAAEMALLDGGVREADVHVAEPWAQVWYSWVSAVYVHGYLDTARDAAFLPSDPESLAMQLERFVLARAFRSLGAELNKPSERVAIPLGLISRMMSVPRESQLPRG